MPKCAYCLTFTGKASEVLGHIQAGCSIDRRWGQVVELRGQGEDGKADKLTRRLLGVYEPMSEEAKAKLRAYAEAHKEELEEKRKAKALLKKRQRELMRATGPTQKPSGPPPQGPHRGRHKFINGKCHRCGKAA